MEKNALVRGGETGRLAGRGGGFNIKYKISSSLALWRDKMFPVGLGCHQVRERQPEFAGDHGEGEVPQLVGGQAGKRRHVALLPE